MPRITASVFVALSLPALCASAGDFSEIVRSIPAGTWKELPDTQMSEVFPAREGHPAWGVSGPESVVSAWGGAAFDTKRNVLMVTGGGHNAYGGNEVYEFNLESLTWKRVTEPSAYEQDPDYSKRSDAQNYVRTLDGSPVSSHTYDGLQFLPDSGSMWQFGGSQWKHGNNSDWHAYVFDPKAKHWVRGTKAPTYMLQVASAWDSKRKRVLSIYKTGLMAYDPETDKWSKVTGGWYSQVGRVAEYDPEHDIFLLIGSKSNKKPIAYVDLKTNKLEEVKLAGDANIPLWSPGLTYDSARKQFVVWGGNREVWTIDPATWVATKFANLQGPAPSSKTADGKAKNHGIYSRWQYAPDYDVFIGYNSARDNVWVYKPQNPVQTPPAPDPVEDPIDDFISECGADLCVGPSYILKTPSDAAAVSREGDVVYIEAGTYTDCAVWPVSVTIRGIRGRPVIGGKVCEGKAVWITQGDRTYIENVKLQQALGGVSNAAAIRHEGGALIVRNAHIFDNHNGILVGHNPDMSVEVYDSVFQHMWTRGDLAHNIYVGKIKQLIVEGNSFSDGESGHFIKSLAAKTRISYNRIIQKKDLNAALIDIWGCTDFEVVGNSMMRTGRYGALAFIQITPRSDGNGKPVPCPETRNPKGLVAYNTVFFNNDLHDDTRWSNLIHYNYPTPDVLVANNVVVHAAKIVSDSKGFDEHGGRTENNYYTRKWGPELFADYLSGDLRLAKPLDQSAVPILFVPKKEADFPVGVRSRIESTTVGAFSYDQLSEDF